MSLNTKEKINKIFKHFDTTPDVIELVNYRFYIVSNIGQTIAWGTHLFWMFIFYELHVYPMAYLQLASIFAYIVAINFNRRGYHLVSMSISMVEIVAHQGLAVLFVGWECGFQYFVPVVAIFPFLIPKGNIFWKWFMFLLCMSGFLFMDFFIRNINPYFQLNPFPVTCLKASNIVLSFGCFAMWAIYLTQAVNRSQIIIEEKTKQIIKTEENAKQAEIQLMLQMKEEENQLISKEKERYQELLLNILPEEVAEELKNNGKTEAKDFEQVTVMFTDFKDFTTISEKLSAKDLVSEIDHCFSAFDNIIQNCGIEKIKTIGDSYMAVGGLPVENKTHARDVVNAAIEINKFMEEHKRQKIKEGKEIFEIRIGIHTGPVVAGIVGIKKFAYDIWGDTVNLASRMESSGEAGKVNISGSTFELVKNNFTCTYRGKIQAKNKGEVDMYFVSEQLIVNN